MTESLRQLFLDNTPLIDVRAPIEFAKGAFPASINLPLLDNEQRHQVGLRYKQAGQQSAIALGESMFAESARDEKVKLWSQYAEANPGTQLYCFRGGLRSKTAQSWLAKSGIDLPVVAGGYKALRQYLLQTAESLCHKLDFLILGGRTGSGKTLLLPHLQRYVDLEGLANHRGSSFGATTLPQPGNASFENAIVIALLSYENKPKFPICLEDEGRMIGSVCLPEVLRHRMLLSPIVLLEESIETRVKVSRQAYIDDLINAYRKLHGETQGMAKFAEHHRQALSKITRRFGATHATQAADLFNQALTTYEKSTDPNIFNSYVKLLLTEYYDPMYDYQLKKKMDRVVFRGNANEVQQWVESSYQS